MRFSPLAAAHPLLIELSVIRKRNGEAVPLSLIGRRLFWWPARGQPMSLKRGVRRARTLVKMELAGPFLLPIIFVAFLGHLFHHIHTQMR